MHIHNKPNNNTSIETKSQTILEIVFWIFCFRNESAATAGVQSHSTKFLHYIIKLVLSKAIILSKVSRIIIILR